MTAPLPDWYKDKDPRPKQKPKCPWCVREGIDVTFINMSDGRPQYNSGIQREVVYYCQCWHCGAHFTAPYDRINDDGSIAPNPYNMAYVPRSTEKA